MHTWIRTAATGGCALVAAGFLYAQRGAGDWLTIGNDPQRSFWVRADPKISIETLSKPGFQLVWKTKFANSARQMSSITPPALFDFYIGYRGFRSLGFFGGSSNAVFALDIDLARSEWEKKFAPVAAGGSTAPCPGGMTTPVARPSAVGYPPAGGRGGGRGNPARSGVGEPYQGAVTLRPAARPAPPPPPPPAAAPGRRTAPPPNPFARGPQYVHAISADGKFHSLYVSNGEEPNPPVDFLPPNAHAAGLLVLGNTAYAATLNGCGGADNGIWALDIAAKKVSNWKAPANIAGTAGFAAGPDGALYVAAGPELVALEPGTLAVRARYNAGKPFTSSPVVFEFQNRDLVAAAAGDSVVVLDAAQLSGAPVASASVTASGALASWQDASGARWLLAPTAKSVAAFRLDAGGGAVALKQAWTSPDMVSPLTPAIVNGVVFALSAGAPRGANAVLYALDPNTGKPLWNSGSAIAGFVRTGGLAGGGGRVYVGGHDGTQYAFGFYMEY